MTEQLAIGGFRFSVRELLLLFAVAAVGCAALRYANQWWLFAASAGTFLAMMAGLVVALIDRGPRQAFAIGFVVWAAVYAAIVLSKTVEGANYPRRNVEFDPYSGALATTQLLRPLFESIVETEWIDPATGQIIAGYNPNQPAGRIAYMRESPSRENFMQIAHCLWTLAAGYAGGKLGRWVYARRVRQRGA
jgi:hypothetical protein